MERIAVVFAVSPEGAGMSAAVWFIAGNLQLILVVIAIAVTIVKVRRARAHHWVVTPSYILWSEVIFYAVGLGFLWFGLMHAFNGPFSASLIGWRSSPFQWELAWGELGLSLVALISLRRGYEMRLAVSLIYAVFSFGAAAQHIQQMACCANYSSGNAGIVLWFGDLALPAFILLLAYLARDADERTRRL